MIKSLLGVILVLPLMADEMQVLMVDQRGRINVPGVLATTAEMTTNANMIAIADAEARAAKKAAAAATNLVNEVVTDIANSHLVVYRRGFTTSFASTVFLSADDKLLIVGLDPFAAGSKDVDGATYYGHKIRYALTTAVGPVKPVVKARDSLVHGDYVAIDDTLVDTPTSVAGTYTATDGTVYEGVYEVTFWQQEADRGFYIMTLTGDTPDGDGSVLDIHGGILGGYTGEEQFGDKRLVFRGGFCVGVTE